LLFIIGGGKEVCKEKLVFLRDGVWLLGKGVGFILFVRIFGAFSITVSEALPLLL
jgi:hypothetical protein